MTNRYPPLGCGFFETPCWQQGLSWVWKRGTHAVTDNNIIFKRLRIEITSVLDADHGFTAFQSPVASRV